MTSSEAPATLVLSRAEIAEIVERLRESIFASVREPSAMLLVGIRRGGVPLVRALADSIERAGHARPPVGTLDINLYRDDVGLARAVPKVGPSQLPGSVESKEVVLVDDVLHTGRTVRAAIDALHDYGRPSRVYLAVLCDRGGRELPIAADFVGREVVVPSERHLEVEFDDEGLHGARLTWPPKAP